MAASSSSSSSSFTVSTSLAEALRQNDPMPALRMAAEQFMGGQLWNLVQTMCKIYILYVHRADIEWMSSCVRWVKHVQELKACYENDHGKWQHDRFTRTELCSLITRIVTAPKQFYTEVLEEWGIPWTGKPTGVRSTSGGGTDPNIQYLLSRVQSDKNERERMEHLMKLNNENTDDAMIVWRRCQTALRELTSERWTMPDVSLYGAAIAAASIGACATTANTTTALRFAEERQLATFESIAQSFFYLLHSMLFDTTRQFGRRTVKLSQYHLWGLLDDITIQDDVLELDELAGVAPVVDVASFRELAMWCSTADPSLNTSAFLVACILIVQRIKTIRFVNEQKRLRDHNASAQAQAMETKKQLLTPMRATTDMGVLGSPYDFLFDRKSRARGATASAASVRQDPALQHQYEQYLTTSFGLSSTFGGGAKNRIEFQA